MRLIVDTNAWIELFKDSPQGLRAKKLIGENECYTSIVSLAEIAKWCVREGKNVEFYLHGIKQTTTVLELNEEIAVSAGLHNYERSSKSRGLTVLTGDKHFQDLPSVEML